MVHSYVVKVFQQQLQIHVLIEHASKILQLKIIKIVIIEFHQMVIIKFVFRMAQVVVFILNNVLHFKDNMQHLHIIQMLYVDLAKVLAFFQYALLIRYPELLFSN